MRIICLHSEITHKILKIEKKIEIFVYKTANLIKASCNLNGSLFSANGILKIDYSKNFSF